MKRILLTLIGCLAGLLSFAQGHMIYGKKHLLTVETPADWSKSAHKQLPYLIVPQASVNQETYMYVCGLDYAINPDVEKWMASNTAALQKAVAGVKATELDMKFDNITTAGYTTGRYKVVSYEYANNRKEILLAIECEHTIVTVSYAVADGALFDKYIPAFKSLVSTLVIAGAEVATVEGA